VLRIICFFYCIYITLLVNKQPAIPRQRKNFCS